MTASPVPFAAQTLHSAADTLAQFPHLDPVVFLREWADELDRTPDPADLVKDRP